MPVNFWDGFIIIGPSGSCFWHCPGGGHKAHMIQYMAARASSFARAAFRLTKLGFDDEGPFSRAQLGRTRIAMTLPQKPSRKAAHNFVVCNMRPSSVRSFNRHAECWYLLLRLALFAVLLAAVSSPANAITYYVSPDGSDKATGTSPQKPWKTIGKVNATALRPGDIVLFKGQATFSGKIYLSPGINGTNGMPITLGSYNPSSGAALSAGAPSTQRATISGGSGGALVGYNNGGFEVRALNGHIST